MTVKAYLQITMTIDNDNRPAAAKSTAIIVNHS